VRSGRTLYVGDRLDNDILPAAHPAVRAALIQASAVSIQPC
jgi:FMN phosphatase YigB (HAD superfamily)